MDHPSIRALGPEAMSAHTVTLGLGPLTYTENATLKAR
jgi:hypothetical protein